MRLFDLIVNALKRTRCDWYQEHVFNEAKGEFEHQMHLVEMENDSLMYQLLRADERIEELEKDLDYYESWRYEDEEES